MSFSDVHFLISNLFFVLNMNINKCDIPARKSFLIMLLKMIFKNIQFIIL